MIIMANTNQTEYIIDHGPWIPGSCRGGRLQSHSSVVMQKHCNSFILNIGTLNVKSMFTKAKFMEISQMRWQVQEKVSYVIILHTVAAKISDKITTG